MGEYTKKARCVSFSGKRGYEALEHLEDVAEKYGLSKSEILVELILHMKNNLDLDVNNLDGHLILHRK